MQISRIYSNRPDIFVPIDFSVRDQSSRLNVILGHVTKPKDRTRDSHNLGKTTLIHLIDFLLLKGAFPDHFLLKHQERFRDFVFCIEIALNSGSYATVRRGVAEPNKIGMMQHDKSQSDLFDCPEDEWSHLDLTRDAAVQLLDGWLDLRVLKPYDYRKALTYFLRTQHDYRDVLQLQKFSAGKDRDWKPFIAHLFGFNESTIRRKYQLDEGIDQLRQSYNQQRTEVQFAEERLPEVAARIKVFRQQVDNIEAAIDSFSFDAEERRMIRDLVSSVEADIAEANDSLYNIRYDIRQIETALDQRDRFDLDKVVEIFKECEVHFPDALKHSYDDLVAFNKKITKERSAALRSRLKELIANGEILKQEKERLDLRRKEQLKVLRDTDTFYKFKELQKELAEQKAELVFLEVQRDKLEALSGLSRQIRKAERERGRVVDEISSLVLKSTPIVERFGATFNGYCQRILNHDGIFYFSVNNSGNLVYEIGLQLGGQKASSSSLSEGTSYKKLICALFDLALLKIYEDAPFFHFVYHDGLLEALDNRKKIELLSLVREEISSSKTQYILSLIDTDLPRDESDRPIQFQEDEVVLQLDDSGDMGRLFKFAEF